MHSLWASETFVMIQFLYEGLNYAFAHRCLFAMNKEFGNRSGIYQK